MAQRAQYYLRALKGCLHAALRKTLDHSSASRALKFFCMQKQPCRAQKQC